MPKKELAKGYTTGTCAQAATRAAMQMLFTGEKVEQVSAGRKAAVGYHGYTEKIYRQGIAGYGILCGQKKQRR